jgi:predicted ATP-dependent protease
LTGDQGVLIPASNVKHLMLRHDIVEAVEEGQFHIYAIETVDQGIEILTGEPAGEPDEDGEYPEASINGRVLKRLKVMAERRQSFEAASAEEDEA